MCGIAGTVGVADKNLIERMTDVLRHRGPDDGGVMVFEKHGVALGHRRLSIIDLSPAGHQPMSNAAGTLWITFNGEIYNYTVIRDELIGKGYQFRSHSDTEVLLAAYEVWGEKCLDKLNGMFAFAIYDMQNRKLFAARDRLGIKPFYYYHDDSFFVFASEIKAILECPFVEKKPDYFALHTPARFQISPYTGFEKIRKLHPGHSLTFQNSQLSIKAYWDIAATEEYDEPEARAIDRLDALLQDAVRLQMVADVPVGMFLSGGLDSSLISALARKNSNGPIHSFTIKFSEADQQFERMPDDSLYARRVAEQFGFEYHEFEIQPEIEELFPKLVWHLDEPLSDPAAINTYLISKAARDHGIIVLLNGMGGDEIFGGYRKQLACLKAELYQQIMPEVVRRVFERAAQALPVASSARGFKTMRWSKRFLSFASLAQADRYLAADLSLSRAQYRKFFLNGVDYAQSHFYVEQSPRFSEEGLSYLTKMCLNDTKVFLPEHNLAYSDKASMAASVESRPPLTDHRLVEFMFSLPPNYRINGNQQKYLMKKVAERYLPKSIVHRPKAPFGSPLRAWIRGPLAPMVDDLLSEERIKARGLYTPTYVSSLIDNDRRGVEDNAMLIWTLLTNEMWFQTFFS